MDSTELISIVTKTTDKADLEIINKVVKSKISALYGVKDLIEKRIGGVTNAQTSFPPQQN